MTMITDRIAKAGRIVIKIGSALLFDPQKEKPGKTGCARWQKMSPNCVHKARRWF